MRGILRTISNNAALVALTSFALIFATYMLVMPARMGSTASPPPPDDAQPNASETLRLVAEAETPQPDPSGPTLQESLWAMDAPSRNSLFEKAIRDAGFGCDEIASAQEAGDRLATWRIVCVGMEAYWVGVDRLGAISVDRLIYSDGLAVPVDIERLQNRDIERVPEPLERR